MRLPQHRRVRQVQDHTYKTIPQDESATPIPAEVGSLPDRMKGKMPTAPRHAIVISAGMSGLLAARVLAEMCAKVTVVERDALPVGFRQPNGARQGDVIPTVCARGLP
jgi:NADPH-dependent 2,4-dienoyl-CoA reductase/sulfur reductase-like enzyme